jgi:hypothetical protein
MPKPGTSTPATGSGTNVVQSKLPAPVINMDSYATMVDFNKLREAVDPLHRYTEAQWKEITDTCKEDLGRHDGQHPFLTNDLSVSAGNWFLMLISIIRNFAHSFDIADAASKTGDQVALHDLNDAAIDINEDLRKKGYGDIADGVSGVSHGSVAPTNAETSVLNQIYTLKNLAGVTADLGHGHDNNPTAGNLSPLPAGSNPNRTLTNANGVT